MNQLEHEWATFYSPRNGRLSIQACKICGVAKGIVTGGHKCTIVSAKQKQSRLRGWELIMVIRFIYCIGYVVLLIKGLLLLSVVDS